MPKNKDLKRLIRARMAKTGESYTAARLHLLAPELPLPDEYEKLAGMSDEAVAKATEKTWQEWTRILDAADASSWDHKAIAAWIHDHHDSVNGWWAQTVTVAYERFRSLREVGQRRGGGYDVNKSKTVPVPISRLYQAFQDPEIRADWLPDVELEVTTANDDKSLRAKLADGTRLEAYFTAKGDAKSSVQVQHRKIADKDSAEGLKAFWAERLTDLAERLKE